MKKTFSGFLTHIWKDKPLVGSMIFMVAFGTITVRPLFWMGISFFTLLLGVLIYEVASYLKK
jgi:hypothetical protein